MKRERTRGGSIDQWVLHNVGHKGNWNGTSLLVGRRLDSRGRRGDVEWVLRKEGSTNKHGSGRTGGAWTTYERSVARPPIWRNMFRQDVSPKNYHVNGPTNSARVFHACEYVPLGGKLAMQCKNLTYHQEELTPRGKVLTSMKLVSTFLLIGGNSS